MNLYVQSYIVSIIMVFIAVWIKQFYDYRWGNKGDNRQYIKSELLQHCAIMAIVTLLGPISIIILIIMGINMAISSIVYFISDQIYTRADKQKIINRVMGGE